MSKVIAFQDCFSLLLLSLAVLNHCPLIHIKCDLVILSWPEMLKLKRATFWLLGESQLLSYVRINDRMDLENTSQPFDSQV